MALKVINDIAIETDCILAVTPLIGKKQTEEVFAFILFKGTDSGNSNMSISKKTYDVLLNEINPGK